MRIGESIQLQTSTFLANILFPNSFQLALLFYCTIDSKKYMPKMPIFLIHLCKGWIFCKIDIFILHTNQISIPFHKHILFSNINCQWFWWQWQYMQPWFSSGLPMIFIYLNLQQKWASQPNYEMHPLPRSIHNPFVNWMKFKSMNNRDNKFSCMKYVCLVKILRMGKNLLKLKFTIKIKFFYRTFMNVGIGNDRIVFALLLLLCLCLLSDHVIMS